MLAHRLLPAALAIAFLFVSMGAHRHIRASTGANHPSRGMRARALNSGFVPSGRPYLNMNAANKAMLRSANADVISNLKGAYSILAKADHDYKGHRVKAMKSIRAAGRALGVRIGGEGTAHEPQPVSDQQLRQAHTLLEQAGTMTTARNLPTVSQHIGAAMSHLKTALSIK